MQTHCLICQSDDLQWTGTYLDNESEGVEVYACGHCKGSVEFGIKIERLAYTGKDDVIPREIE